MKSFLLKSYFFLFVVFAIFSFVLTDPNLTLLNLNFFVSLQTYLWQHVLPLQNFRTIFYGVLITLIFINYLLILKNWYGLKLDVRQNFWKFLIIVSLPLIFSYNALSHDLFNYIFNAKMIIEYGANPHVQTTINFPNDPMLRFMNNIHTPAPYGYGWTTLSLLPYLAGLGKFLSTFIIFKLFAFLSLILALLISEKFWRKANYFKLALFFLNPLLLIEILSSAHNDLWMLAPALLAVYLATNLQKKKFFKIILIAVLLAVSISIKFATIVLLPLIIYLALKNRLGRLGKFPTYDLMALTMFAPLLTERSKQFLPWYLLWSLIFLPLIKNKFLRNLLIVFSFSSLLRYLPWMYYLPWMSFHLDSSSLESLQKAITWLIPSFYLLLSATFFLFNRRSEK